MDYHYGVGADRLCPRHRQCNAFIANAPVSVIRHSAFSFIDSHVSSLVVKRFCINGSSMWENGYGKLLNNVRFYLNR